MATFAKASFDVASYLASRPTYPARIFDIITAYHGQTGRWDRLLDIGCGPGFVALALAPKFRETTAIDPSEGMVAKGIQPSDPTTPNITYKVGTAEDLAAAGIGSGEAGVDLAIAGQAAHWFDYPKVWRQFTNHVRPGGTVAFIGYAEMVFPHHPHLNALISHHAHHKSALGPYWQPGRKIVEALLDPIPFPVPPTPSPSNPHSSSSSSTTSGINRVWTSLPPLELNGGHPISSLLSPEPILPSPKDLEPIDQDSWDATSAVRFKSDTENGPWLMRKTFNKTSLEGYLRSFSALHDYHENNPDDKAKKGSGEGDIVDRLSRAIWEGVEKDGPMGGEKAGEVVVGWPLVLMMIRKKTAV